VIQLQRKIKSGVRLSKGLLCTDAELGKKWHNLQLQSETHHHAPAGPYLFMMRGMNDGIRGNPHATR
jgi:hypothetical protein